ncbi:hypothetical protein LINPERPRIM_LOCUS1273 [Linum perenne]
MGKGEIRWPDFRAWARRVCGIPSNSACFPLGDGLWLLECASSAEASKILVLRRQRFGSFEVFLYAWIKEAGRSDVLWVSDNTWVVVRGIPLHLRSSTLARRFAIAFWSDFVSRPKAPGFGLGGAIDSSDGGCGGGRKSSMIR